MKYVKHYVLALILSMLSFSVFAATADAKAEAAVTKAGQAWQQAIASRDAQKITALYSSNANLYPTFDNMVDDHAGLLAYFKKISQNKDLKVVFDKEHIQVYGDVAVNSGLYTFSYQQKGKEISVPARYTFVYLHQGDQWLIVDHHSSELPKPVEGNPV